MDLLGRQRARPGSYSCLYGNPSIAVLSEVVLRTGVGGEKGDTLLQGEPGSARAKVSTVGQRDTSNPNTSEGFLKEAGAVLDLSRQDSAS